MKASALSLFFLLVTLFGIAIAQEPIADSGLRQRRLGKGDDDEFTSNYADFLNNTLDQKADESGKGGRVSSSTAMSLDVKKIVDSQCSSSEIFLLVCCFHSVVIAGTAAISRTSCSSLNH